MDGTTTSTRREDIFALAGQLLDAASDATAWPAFLTGFAREFRAFGAQLVFLDECHARASFQFVVGFEPEVIATLGAKYTELAIYDDPRSPYWMNDRNHPAHGKFTPEEIASFTRGRSVHCRMLFGDDVWHASRMYHEVCGPAGIEYGMYRINGMTDDWSANVALMRGPDDGPFTAADCARLDLWGPMLDRAVAIHRQFMAAEHDRETVHGVLDALNVGLCIVDDQLQVSFANRAARAILDRRDGIDGARRQLRLGDRSAHARLAAAAKRQTGVDGTASAVPIVLESVSRQPAYSLLVAPLWQRLRNAEAIPLERPSAVVFIAPCEAPPSVTRTVLEHMWGLTAAEARVLGELVDGRSVGEAADALAVTVHTVRKHLKAIFSKTGTRSQADLIRLVAGSAAWFGTASPGES